VDLQLSSFLSGLAIGKQSTDLQHCRTQSQMDSSRLLDLPATRASSDPALHPKPVHPVAQAHQWLGPGASSQSLIITSRILTLELNYHLDSHPDCSPPHSSKSGPEISGPTRCTWAVNLQEEPTSTSNPTRLQGGECLWSAWGVCLKSLRRVCRFSS
jgi:hypothetical protein